MTVEGDTRRRNAERVTGDGIRSARVETAACIARGARQTAISPELGNEHRTPGVPRQLGCPGDLPRGKVGIPVEYQDETAFGDLTDEIGEQWLAIGSAELDPAGAPPIGKWWSRRLEDEPFLIVPDEHRRHQTDGGDNANDAHQRRQD